MSDWTDSVIAAELGYVLAVSSRERRALAARARPAALTAPDPGPERNDTVGPAREDVDTDTASLAVLAVLDLRDDVVGSSDATGPGDGAPVDERPVTHDGAAHPDRGSSRDGSDLAVSSGEAPRDDGPQAVDPGDEQGEEPREPADEPEVAPRSDPEDEAASDDEVTAEGHPDASDDAADPAPETLFWSLAKNGTAAWGYEPSVDEIVGYWRGLIDETRTAASESEGGIAPRRTDGSPDPDATPTPQDPTDAGTAAGDGAGVPADGSSEDPDAPMQPAPAVPELAVAPDAVAWLAVPLAEPPAVAPWASDELIEGWVSPLAPGLDGPSEPDDSAGPGSDAAAGGPVAAGGDAEPPVDDAAVGADATDSGDDAPVGGQAVDPGDDVVGSGGDEVVDGEAAGVGHAGDGPPVPSAGSAVGAERGTGTGAASEPASRGADAPAGRELAVVPEAVAWLAVPVLDAPAFELLKPGEPQHVAALPPVAGSVPVTGPSRVASAAGPVPVTGPAPVVPGPGPVPPIPIVPDDQVPRVGPGSPDPAPGDGDEATAGPADPDGLDPDDPGDPDGPDGPDGELALAGCLALVGAARQADASSFRPVGLAGGGLAFADCLGLLERRRRVQLARRRPGRQVALPVAPLDAYERELRHGADVEAATLLEVALRAAAAGAGEQGLPPLRWVEASPHQVTLVLAATTPEPVPPGFVRADGEVGWTTAAGLDELTSAAAPVLEPLRALVPVGATADGREVLVDVESLGVVNVDGPREDALGLLRAAVVGLATAAWCEPLRIVVVGMERELEDLPGVAAVGTLEEALARAEDHADRVAATLAAQGHQDTGRARADSSSVQPDEALVVVSALAPQDEQAWRRVTALARRRRQGVGLVLQGLAGAGADAGAGTDGADAAGGPGRGADVCRVRIGAAGSVRIDGLAPAGDDGGALDRDLWARRLDAADVRALLGLLDVALRRDGGEPVRHPRPGRAAVGGAAGDPVVEVPPGLDDVAPPGDVLVRVLGEVEAVQLAEGAERRLEPAGPGALEVLTYLALRESSVTYGTIEVNLFPHGTGAAGDVDDVVHEARALVGPGLLPRPTGGRYGLSDRVVTDYAVFCGLTAQAAEAPDPTRAELLTGALSLVRSEPLGGAGQRYPWAGPQRVTMVAHVVDTAEILAELRAAEQEWVAVEWAVQQGLKVAPGDEQLHRWLMRAAHARGDMDRVHQLFDDLCDLVADPVVGVEPEDTLQPESLQLLEALASRRVAPVRPELPPAAGPSELPVGSSAQGDASGPTTGVGGRAEPEVAVTAELPEVAEPGAGMTTEAVEPDVAEPEVAEPGAGMTTEAVEPDVVEPEVAEPGAGVSAGMAEPDVVEPQVAVGSTVRRDAAGFVIAPAVTAELPEVAEDRLPVTAPLPDPPPLPAEASVSGPG